MPFTKGDAITFLVGLGIALLGGFVVGLEQLINADLAAFDWGRWVAVTLSAITTSTAIYIIAWYRGVVEREKPQS